MKRSLQRLAAATAGLALLCASCVRMPAGVTSSTLPITAADEYTVTGEVWGTDSALGLFSFAIFPYSAYDAIQDCKRRNGVDGMIEVTAENEIFYIFLITNILTWHTIKVRGQGIQFTKGGPNT